MHGGLLIPEGTFNIDEVFNFCLVEFSSVLFIFIESKRIQIFLHVLVLWCALHVIAELNT